jgi:NAD(P)-dependent dehydrogenase (short-subunit alcohol dehydrogenase family)
MVEREGNGGVAVVTGGSRGIGAATALLLAERGWSVCLSYREAGAQAEAVVAACRAWDVDAVAVQADLRGDEGVAAVFAAADALGRVGALVNNAGIVDVRARVDEMDEARVVRMLTTNVLGPLLCAGAAVRRMSTRRGGLGGVIVNVSSAASRLGSPGEYVDYAASKGAVDTFTIGLAREVADEGIRVNAVRPGLIDTEIHAAGGQPDRLERLRPVIPLQRAGSAAEVAQSIVWLCSPDSSYVTGALLDVSGGR